MRKLFALCAASALELMTACEGATAPRNEPVNLTCSITVPVTQMVKKDSQSVTLNGTCTTVTVTSRTGTYVGGKILSISNSSITIDLSSVAAGDTVTFVGGIDGKPLTAPASIAVIQAIPASLEIVYGGSATVTTATQVKFRLKRTDVGCTDLLTNMPVSPDSAASVPRLIRSQSDSDAVTLDVGTIRGNYVYTMTCSGNDGSSATKSLAIQVISVALDSTTVTMTPVHLPAHHTNVEIHFYSKCGFASGNGPGFDRNNGHNQPSMVGFMYGPATTKYYDCSHISTFSSASNNSPNASGAAVYLYQPGRDSVYVGMSIVDGQPSSSVQASSALGFLTDSKPSGTRTLGGQSIALK